MVEFRASLGEDGAKLLSCADLSTVFCKVVLPKLTNANIADQFPILITSAMILQYVERRMPCAQARDSSLYAGTPK